MFPIMLRVLDFAQRYTASIHWESFDEARHMLECTYAFLRTREAEALGRRQSIVSGGINE